MKLFILFSFLVFIFLGIPFCSAAHWITGIVNDALDGTGADDHTIFLWRADNSADNLSDIIGANGNSGTSNWYMINCQLLNDKCKVGDIMTLQVVDNGDTYITKAINVTVTTSGFTLASNLTLNSPPNISSILVDDALNTPANEIDLIAASTREVKCEAVVEELDGDSLQGVSSEFFNNIDSGYGYLDDNNSHYTNSTCFLNSSYGNENETLAICNFSVWYYADSQTWNCTINAEDNLSVAKNASNTSFINTLLSVGLVDSIDLGDATPDTVSNESLLNVTNYGNVEINLSLSGYAVNIADGFAMNCTAGNISIDYLKYNLTDSILGILNLAQFEATYENLTANPVIKEFNLNYRKNEDYNEAANETYWRIYAPVGVAKDCQGHIVFGATQSAVT